MHRRHVPVDAGTSPSLTTIWEPGFTTDITTQWSAILVLSTLYGVKRAVEWEKQLLDVVQISKGFLTFASKLLILWYKP